MSKYKELVVNELFDKNNNAEFEAYCLNVNDLLLSVIDNVENIRKIFLRDSINTNENIAYYDKHKQCSRTEYLSLQIENSMKNQLQCIKKQLEFFS